MLISRGSVSKSHDDVLYEVSHIISGLISWLYQVRFQMLRRQQRCDWFQGVIGHEIWPALSLLIHPGATSSTQQTREA
jgi:hypothetical protein